MERRLRFGLLLAVIALFAVGCSARSLSGSAGAAPAGVAHPADENGNRHGNLYGTAGPWNFLFDFGNEEVRTSETLDTTASEIAAYTRRHPDATIWLDGYAMPRDTDPNARAVRAHRLDAVYAALIKSGVPADRIRRGTGGTSQFTGGPPAFKW